MAAYDALVSLAQTTDLNRYHYQGKCLFPVEAEGTIRSIHEFVVYLQSSLENFPEKTRRWEGRIRDLAHEAENFIENFIWLRIQTPIEGINLPDLEDQLENVKEKIGLIAGEVMDERPDAVPSSSSRLAPAGNDAVIGLDDDLTKIRGRLCGEPLDLQIIPIVGMGGIGKTTLATTVYNHASILDYFDFRAWITVSQDYSTHSFRKILLGLLESMNLLEELVSRKKSDRCDEEGYQDLNKQLEKIDESELETQVFKGLKYRRYLIVMDDVWSTQVCDDLIRIFPDDGNGSRIILTTRLSDVAAYPNSNSPLHEMQAMNGAQSWNLLKQKVNCPPHLEGIGEEIAKNCAGLPLTLVLTAGLLSAANNSRASWEEIGRNVNRVVGGELSEILSLSYTHLPHHLRPCFLYFGGFPEDEKIRAATLTKLWVAEGFVRHQNKSLEEEGEEYLEDLVRRNLVIVNSRKMNGRIRSCSLHDMVRELCIRKAHEEKFLRVVDGSVISRGVIDERRISLMLSDMDSLWMPNTRTILSFNLETIYYLEKFLGHYRLLRVWHDASVSDKVLTYQVLKLFHLRYLALNGRFYITSAISNLVNLQTLIILPTYSGKKRIWIHGHRYDIRLPLEIWRMPQLRHLIFNRLCILPHPPDGSDLPLQNLQTLSTMKNLVWSEKMVQMIPNVKRLELVYTSEQNYYLHHLKDLLHLEKLLVVLLGSSSTLLGSSSLWNYLKPTFPTTLKKLSLVSLRFLWADMSIIGSLPNLQVLELLDHACYGGTWETGDDEFPELKYLLINVSLLRHWIMQSSSFPSLERLVLRSCPWLRKIPEEMGEISALELIDVANCNNSVLESASQIKEFKHAAGDDAFQVRLTTVMRPSKFKS